VWERVVTLEILSSRLHAPDFERASEDYFAVSFLFPEWESLDPLKEANANVALLDAGIRSRAEIIAARGRDPEDVDAEIAADTFIPRINPSAAAAGALANVESQNVQP
jgi:capsid protein